MTKYLQKSFSVGGASSNEYRQNYERIFSKESPGPLPDPLQRDASEQKTTLHDVTIRLPAGDLEALKLWATEHKDESPLDPDVAHTVLMAAADAVAAK